jgi:formate dehydrogenase subunit gamma
MPAGRHILHVCRAESCHASGAEKIVAHLEDRLGIEIGGTIPDGSLTVSPIYCLGNCRHSPAVLLDGEPHGPVTVEALDLLIKQLRHHNDDDSKSK